ncbi:hypothetical protein Baya_15801 [Bagarius yarrelli]|uniref:Uncharacterized protein n=1 Tax=Bagarius yarrelli TaxID=175774 RepID=A0A556VCP3_BAGYA|nr:hypothetical protein Baya_15801 [Bagarius yarrelli]
MSNIRNVCGNVSSASSLSSSSSALIRSPIKTARRASVRKSCSLSTPPKPAATNDQNTVATQSPRKRKATLETKVEEEQPSVVFQSPQTPPSGKAKRTKRASAVEPVQEGLELCDQSGKKWRLGNLLSQTEVELTYAGDESAVHGEAGLLGVEVGIQRSARWIPERTADFQAAMRRYGTEGESEPWIEQLILNYGSEEQVASVKAHVVGMRAMPVCCSCLMGRCLSPRCSAPPPGSKFRKLPLSCLMRAWHDDIISDLLKDAIKKIATPTAGYLGMATPTHWHRERIRCKRKMLTADPGVSSSRETPSSTAPPLRAETMEGPITTQEQGGDSSAVASDRLEDEQQLNMDNTRAGFLQLDSRSRVTSPPFQWPHPTPHSPAHQDGSSFSYTYKPSRNVSLALSQTE